MVEQDIPRKLKQEPDQKPYQKRLQEAREELLYPLPQLGEAVGMSFQAISQFEKGISSMSLEKFLRLCQVLHLRTEWVLHGRGARFEGGPPVVPRVRHRPAKRTPKED